MRLLPTVADMPPEDQGASSVEIDASTLEASSEGETLFDRLKDVAVAVMEPHVKRDFIQKQLLPQHTPILLMRVQGFRQYEIAQALGIDRTTVSSVLRSEAGRNILMQLYAEAGFQMSDVGRSFVDAAPMAAEVLLELAENGTKEETRLKAAFSILDRAGYGAIKKNESKVTVEHKATVSTAELDELRQALREAIEVDAEFEVVEEEPSSAEDAA